MFDPAEASATGPGSAPAHAPPAATPGPGGDALAEAPVGVGLIDAGLRYVRVNPVLAAMNGRTVADHLGKTVEEVIPGLAPAIVPVLRRVLQSGHPEVVPVGGPVTPGVDAGQRWLARYYPVRDGAGRVSGVGCVVMEVTPGDASAEAPGGEARLAAALDAADTGAFEVDRQTGVVTLSEPAERLLGLAPGAFAGTTAALLALIHPDDRRQVEALESEAAGDRPFLIEFRIRRASDGAPRWIRANGRFVRDRDGSSIRSLGTVTDVTEQREAGAADARRARRERRIAETLQRSLLSLPPVAEFPGFRVCSRHEPASAEADVGGDFADAFALPGGRVAAVVGDVSGKGLAAAARTAQCRYLLRAALRRTPNDPARAVAALNDDLILAREMDGEDPAAFVGLAVAVLEPDTGAAALVVAGMEAPLVLRRGRASGGTAVEAVADGHPPVGLFPGAGFPATPVRLAPGDRLLLATDGVTDARRTGATALDMLGHVGLAALAAGAAALPSPEAALAHVANGARDFADGRFHDDTCLLVAEYAPAGQD